MALEPTNPNAPSNNGEKQKNLDHDIRELISTLTSRLQLSTKTGESGNEDEEDEGVKIITLAGSNQGASMRGEPEVGIAVEPEQEDFSTFVNSNFQAINNSIMLGGSYETNDPGVHLDIQDDLGEEEATKAMHRKKKKAAARAHRSHRSDPQSGHLNKASDGEKN